MNKYIVAFCATIARILPTLSAEQNILDTPPLFHSSNEGDWSNPVVKEYVASFFDINHGFFMTDDKKRASGYYSNHKAPGAQATHINNYNPQNPGILGVFGIILNEQNQHNIIKQMEKYALIGEGGITNYEFSPQIDFVVQYLTDIGEPLQLKPQHILMPITIDDPRLDNGYADDRTFEKNQLVCYILPLLSKANFSFFKDPLSAHPGVPNNMTILSGNTHNIDGIIVGEDSIFLSIVKTAENGKTVLRPTIHWLTSLESTERISNLNGACLYDPDMWNLGAYLKSISDYIPIMKDSFNLIGIQF